MLDDHVEAEADFENLSRTWVAASAFQRGASTSHRGRPGYQVVRDRAERGWPRPVWGWSNLNPDHGPNAAQRRPNCARIDAKSLLYFPLSWHDVYVSS